MLLKKKLFALLTVVLFLFNGLKPVAIDSSNLFVPKALGDLQLFHEEGGFSVKKDGEIHHVQNCFVDKEIRNLSIEQLQRLLGNIKDVEINGQKLIMFKVSSEKLEEISKNIDMQIDEQSVFELTEKDSKKIFKKFAQSSYITVSQMSDGEYSLKFKHRMLGGGVFGAIGGALLGKAVVSLVGHGTIAIISFGAGLVATPAGGVTTGIVLESWFGAWIEAASIKGALMGSLAGAVATGPI